MVADGIEFEVEGKWHEPYIKGFCVGCKQFDVFLSQIKPDRWRCDPCRTAESTLPTAEEKKS